MAIAVYTEYKVVNPYGPVMFYSWASYCRPGPQWRLYNVNGLSKTPRYLSQRTR